MKRDPEIRKSPAPAKQLDSFIAKFDPEVARLTRASLKILRQRFATAFELVYDNYNALAIGWSPNGRTSEVICSLAVYASGVNLYFMYGAKLKDPHKLLQGQGNRGRFIRLDNAERILDPKVARLLDDATKLGDTPLPKTGKRQLIIRSVSANQRNRRSPKK
jgi:hypothetical protein